jgi:hypothetical protein
MELMRVTRPASASLDASQCDRAALRFSGTVTIPRTLWRLFAMNYALLIRHLLFDAWIAHRRIWQAWYAIEGEQRKSRLAVLSIIGLR